MGRVACLMLFAVGCGRLGYSAEERINIIDASSLPTSDAFLPIDDGGFVDGGTSPGLGCLWTVDLDAANQANDGEIGGGFWYSQGETPTSGAYGVFMGSSNGSHIWGYFRFKLPANLPIGTGFRKATLSLWGADVATVSDGLEILLENTSSAPLVTSLADDPDTGGRALSTASVKWPQSGALSWAQATYNRSPDLGTILNELITQHGGLTKGNHVQFWVRGSTTTTNDLALTPDSFYRLDYHPAQLEVDVCTN